MSEERAIDDLAAAVRQSHAELLQRITDEGVSVRLRRSESTPTGDQPLWTVIRYSTKALSFDSYSEFMDWVLCPDARDPTAGPRLDQARADARDLQRRRSLPFPDTDAYRLLKVATEVFMMANCGVVLDRLQFAELPGLDLASEGDRFGRPVTAPELQTFWDAYITTVNGRKTLPYLELIRRKLGEVSLGRDHDPDVVDCHGILLDKLTQPCLLELIWSYWLEEGMLVQTLNAISWRFQNRRGPRNPDPLAHLELDPLRPLNNFLWGYVQDEPHRLTIPRRAYEYNHHYGLTMYGRAVPRLRSADSRSRFLEAFHNLLHLCWVFFKEDDDTTVVADGFPIRNALRNVHLLLTEGAHNQYGDLPWTARQEMLMQQWLLARPEMREFLPTRVMVAQPEPWMDRVDTMKTLQGWTDVSVLHFRDLAVFGEQILLSVRFGNWNGPIEPAQAANWARYWRPEIQGYVSAYRAVTGVDLAEAVDATIPGLHLRHRLGLPARNGHGAWAPARRRVR